MTFQDISMAVLICGLLASWTCVRDVLGVSKLSSLTF
jgi:hypothetical protein